MKRMITMVMIVLSLLFFFRSAQANREMYDQNVALEEQADALAKQIQDMDRRIADARATLANLEYVEKANREYLEQLKNPK